MYICVERQNAPPRCLEFRSWGYLSLPEIKNALKSGLDTVYLVKSTVLYLYT